MSGDQKNTEPSGVTETHLIIIGTVCALVIVSLLIILFIVLCRRRNRNNKEYQSAATSQTQQNQTSMVKPTVGFINTDDDKKVGIPLQMKHNGNVPLDTSYDSQLERRMYENEMNLRNEHMNIDQQPGLDNRQREFHNQPSPAKNKFLNLSGDMVEGVGPDSGFSTPDTGIKPKKVIYEVIV